MKKDIKRMFLAICFYGLACGLYFNFLELWMAENNLSTKTIGIILSLCALIGASVVFLFSNIVKKDKIKKLLIGILSLRVFNLLALYLLNGTNQFFLIKFIVLIDFAIDVEAGACIYPLLSIINEDNKYFAKKDIYYNAFYYLAILITTFLLGKEVFGVNLGYNSYNFFSLISLLITILFLSKINFKKYMDKDIDKRDNLDIFKEFLKKLKKDKISLNYFGYLLLSQFSYYSVYALTLTLLTKNIGLSPSTASNILLISGVVSIGIGSLVLSFFTFKNNKLNISIKLVTRVSLFLFAALTCNKYIILAAIIFPKLMGVSYTHITEAPYINRMSEKYRFAFVNLREIVTYLGRAIGTFIGSFIFLYGNRVIFLVAFFFGLIQLYFAFKSLSLRESEKK